MTKFLPLFIALIAFNVCHTLGQFRDIIDVLESTPECTGWAKILRNYPVIYEAYAHLENATLFVPSNKAIKKYARAGGSVYRRSLADDSSQAGYQTANRRRSIQQTQQQGASVAETADTSTSPGGNPSVIVTKPAGLNVLKRRTSSKLYFPEPKPPGITVVTGAGESAELLFGDIECKQGLIQVVDSVFNLPIELTETLKATGLTDFFDAVYDAGLGGTLDKTHQVTIFAPVNEDCRNETLCVENYIVLDKALYSPLLHDGDIFTSMDGTTLNITVKHDGTYVNCVRIISSDLITSNGVLHSLESDFPKY